MKQAVVINVGHDPAALKQAIDTQMLLLDRLGAKLHSIRLAAPTLLYRACASAIAEKPDLLVIVGGPRSARRAGQLAYENDTPILFLPSRRNLEWARGLWNALTLEDMVAALARGDLQPVRIGVGTAANEIFFEQACCGLLLHLPELREALDEADTFGEGWQVLARAAQLSHLLLRPDIRFRFGNRDLHRASALTLRAAEPHARIESLCGARHSALTCSAMQYGALGVLGGLMRKALGERWGDLRKEQFECSRLLVESSRPNWILLDGDPIRFDGVVEFRFVPNAIRTFMFSPTPRPVDDNPKIGLRGFQAST